MKGLLLKDFYSLRTYAKTMVFALLIFGVTSYFLDGGANYISSMLMFFLIMTINSVFSFDETAKWDRYAISMPLSRRTIVLSRYVFAAILMAAVTALAFVMGTVIGIIKNEPNWLPSLSLTLCIMVTLNLLVSSIYYPIMYKLGAEKGRYIMIVLYVLPVFLGIFILSMLEKHVGLNLSSISDSMAAIAALIALVVAAGVFFLSHFVAQRMYAKREF